MKITVKLPNEVIVSKHMWRNLFLVTLCYSVLNKLNLLHFFSWCYLCNPICYRRGSKTTPFGVFFLIFFSVRATGLNFSDFFFIVKDVFWQIFSGVAPFSQNLFQTTWKKVPKNVEKVKICQEWVTKRANQVVSFFCSNILYCNGLIA